MEVQAQQDDSTRAANLMAMFGVGCLVTLGGDGTNRAVFKGCGSRVPILPISTGTNNVFPEFQEGTTAGLAAAMVATGAVAREAACWRSKVLHIYCHGEPVNLALVDLAIASDGVIGARAIWEVNRLSELFLTRAHPWSIGLSAIGGMLHPLDAHSPSGLHLVFGDGGQTVQAPIGPGLFATLHVRHVRTLTPGQRTQLNKLGTQAISAITASRDLTGGYAFRIDPQAASLVDVAQWLDLWRRCCPFYEFEIDLRAADAQLWLSVKGRPGVKQYIPVDSPGLAKKLPR